ncbi:MAG TPA: transglycosylase domain-containing protein [Kofleriaceae bacterium]|nr:transglycosylase domain-containing protein [Kofleriaceae bacterium]
MQRVRIANRRRGGWWYGPLLLVAWLVTAAPLVAGALAIATLRRWSRDLPPVPDLAAWTAGAPRTSRIVAADGTVLAELPFTDGAATGHREPIELARVPRHVIDAVLAAEDVRFWSHHGVDERAILRAALANYHAGRVVSGASTITQQLARNLLPVAIGDERSLRRKVREALLARRLEQVATKAEILTAYLDLVFLGDHAYGLAAGADAYFGKDVGALTLPEGALLAGLIQAPGRLEPRRDPAAARARRDEVLDRMLRAGLIDERAHAAAVAAPLGLAHRAPLYGTRAPWYTEDVRRQLADAWAAPLARGGLTVETAALPALARIADDEVVRAGDRLRGCDPAGSHPGRSIPTREDAGRDLERSGAARCARGSGGEPPEAAAVVWDHRTGYVEAMTGGRRWTDSQFDRLTQACRQPGSAWKPVLYAAALLDGAITAGTPLRDAPIAEYDDATGVHWRPRSGSHFRGVALAADALASSLNAPAIDVLDRVGARKVIDLARRLGITTPITDLEPMALGASCVKPLELARAYAILARRGWDVVPRTIVRIRRGDDVLVDDAAPEDPWIDPGRRLDRLAAVAGLDPAARLGAPGGQLVDPQQAFILDDLMTGVIRRGTATAARALGRPAAGKTGTTNDSTDAWFVGFTDRVTAAVWVGHDQPSHTLPAGSDGAHAALPTWMQLVRGAEGSRPPVDVPGPPPPGLERVRIDRETGLVSAPGAGGGLDLWFVVGTEPAERADQPPAADLDLARTARQF